MNLRRGRKSDDEVVCVFRIQEQPAHHERNISLDRGY
jgi:hypothetical protein